MRFLTETAVVAGVALCGALAQHQVTGGIDRSVACEESVLKPGQVCLRTAREWAAAGEDVVWVDARKRSLWKKNGLDGAVFLTDDPKEDWDALLAVAGEKLAMADKAVVYCARKGCGSSEAVARKIREVGLTEDVFVLFGGWRALEAEKAGE